MHLFNGAINFSHLVVALTVPAERGRVDLKTRHREFLGAVAKKFSHRGLKKSHKPKGRNNAEVPEKEADSLEMEACALLCHLQARTKCHRDHAAYPEPGEKFLADKGPLYDVLTVVEWVLGP